MPCRREEVLPDRAGILRFGSWLVIFGGQNIFDPPERVVDGFPLNGLGPNHSVRTEGSHSKYIFYFTQICPAGLYRLFASSGAHVIV
jgi:hypothetical protein